MRTFRAIFRLEAGNFFYKRNLVIFLCMLTFSLILAQDGANSYKSRLKKMKTFVEVEDAKVKHYVLSTQYGTLGIRVLFTPSPMVCLLDNHLAFDELVATVNVGERLNIYNSYKGEKLFARSGNVLNFSAFLLIFGSILAIFYGYTSLNSKDYLRFLVSVTGARRLFFSIVLSRIILISLAMAVIFLCSNVLICLNGFNLFNGYSLVAFGMMLLLYGFFLLAGTVAAMAKTRFKGFFTCLIILFVFFLAFPWLMDKAVKMEARLLPSNYKIDLEKFKLVMGFEQKFYKEVGIYRSGKGKIAPKRVKELIRGYMENEYRTIVMKENLLKTRVDEMIAYHNLVNSFLPTTFCTSVNCEVSSKGFRNFLRFYNYAQNLKDAFFKHYIKLKYFEPSDKIKPFFKKKDYIFSGESHLPRHFYLGLSLMLLYIAVLLMAGQYRFRQYLFKFGLIGLNVTDDQEIKMGRGDNLWLNVDKNGVDYIYNIAFGEHKESDGKFTIDGEDVLGKEKGNCIYLCEPASIPGSLTPATFFRFLKILFGLTSANLKDLESIFRKNRLKTPFEDIDLSGKGKALFAALRYKPFKFYLFHDFFKGIPALILSYFSSEINTITDRGGTVIYLSLDDSYSLYTQANRFAKIYKAGDVYTFNELSNGNRDD